MKIIHKYIIREFSESFLFGLLVFSSILLLDQVFQLVNLILGKGVSFFTVLHLFLLILPNILSLTIPMAVLFGILLSFGRLSEDNEITALRSTGLKYFSFTFPIYIVILILSIFLVYFNQNTAPATHKQFRTAYKEILQQKPLVKFEPNSITKLNEFKIYVNDVDKKTNQLIGVNIYKFSKPDEDSSKSNWRISSSSAGVILSQDSIIFDLYNGNWLKPNPSIPENLIHLKFTKYRLNIPIAQDKTTVSQSLKEMTGAELRNEINEYKHKNMPPNFLETEYYLRNSLAFASFVFAIIAIPLGIIFEKGGKSISFGLSIVVLFGYYVFLIMGLNFSEKGYASPKFILWLPNIVWFIIGLFLWKKMIKK